MVIFGLGIHIFVAIFFAIHAMRTGREIYWLVILFMFPMLGSIVYFVAIYLPGSRLPFDMRKVTAAAIQHIDPQKELREAEVAFDLTSTAQNQMRLANALLEAGETSKAVQHFNAILNGPFANDPEICFGAVQAKFVNGEYVAVIDLIQKIRKINNMFRPEELSVLLAKAYASSEKEQDARNEFVDAINRYGGFEARAEYVIWALKIGDFEAAMVQQKNIEQIIKHWNKHTRSINQELINRLSDEFAAYGIKNKN